MPETDMEARVIVLLLVLLLMASALSFAVSAYEIAFHGFVPSKFSMVIAFVIAALEVAMTAVKTLRDDQ